jgi:hypothetical protein
MLENNHIQTRGFHNMVDEKGVVMGFQFCMRTMYYKGLWLSQLRVGNVYIDDEVFPRDRQIWEINGTDYTPDQMLEIGDNDEAAYFQVTDVATIKVKKAGGVSQGYHMVALEFGWTCNYIPPMVYSNRELGVSFTGDYRREKRLLIV